MANRSSLLPRQDKIGLSGPQPTKHYIKIAYRPPVGLDLCINKAHLYHNRSKNRNSNSQDRANSWQWSTRVNKEWCKSAPREPWSKQANCPMSCFTIWLFLLLWYRGPIITAAPRRTRVVMRVAGEQMGHTQSLFIQACPETLEPASQQHMLVKKNACIHRPTHSALSSLSASSFRPLPLH